MGCLVSYRIARVRHYSRPHSQDPLTSRTGFSPSMTVSSNHLPVPLDYLVTTRQLVGMQRSTPSVQRLPAWHTYGLGSSRFARHYYGSPICSSGYMRWFSSPGSLRLRGPAFAGGCPIRISWDYRLLAAPPRFSQRSHVLLRHAAPRHPPCAHSVFPTGRPRPQSSAHTQVSAHDPASRHSSSPDHDTQRSTAATTMRMVFVVTHLYLERCVAAPSPLNRDDHFL